MAIHKSVKPFGVLIMAYGGPDSLNELPGFLSDIRSGRPTTPAVLKEISNNYRMIGGKSPLPDFTRRQISAIQQALDPARYRCYSGMRHWSPWIEDVVGQMIGDGVTHAVSLVLTPHYSKLSIAKYQEKIQVGMDMYRGHIQFAHISSYHDASDYIQALANRVQTGLAEWSERDRADVHIILSAHSLPTRILRMNDPYDAQLRETAQLVAEKAELPESQWSWSYQSAGRSPEPWLGPQLDEHLDELAAQGIRNIVSIPVGFVSDHVEILYDIDIMAKQHAESLGMRLVRPPALNDDPLYIKTLVDLIQAEASDWL